MKDFSDWQKAIVPRKASSMESKLWLKQSHFHDHLGGGEEARMFVFSVENKKCFIGGGTLLSPLETIS